MGNEEPETVFGRRVREERERRGWRLTDLAAAAAELGLDRHQSFYAKVETGAQAPRLGEAVTIAAALGQPLSALLIASAGEIAARSAELTEEALQAARRAGDETILAARLLNEAQELARTQAEGTD